MKKALIDTNIISVFMRGNPFVIQKAKNTCASINVMSACEVLDLDSSTAEELLKFMII